MTTTGGVPPELDPRELLELREPLELRELPDCGPPLDDPVSPGLESGSPVLGLPGLGSPTLDGGSIFDVEEEDMLVSNGSKKPGYPGDMEMC